MAVRIEGEGAVATVVIDRPERRNAVDAQTARAGRRARASKEGSASPEAPAVTVPRLVRGH